jgi:hypothetical protein
MSILNSKATPTPDALRQLALPLPADEPPCSPPLPVLCSLPARRIWKTLSRAQQRKVRQTWLHVLREVVHE